jgi:tRNA nucleotidyltransferase (CCA-adding enzyme)
MRETTFPERLHITDETLRIAAKLEDAGYETWCVGGAVRDQVIFADDPNFDPSKSEVDLATSAHPSDVQKLFRRTIPVGVEHGTVAVLDREKHPHHVTTFRKDIKTDGRHAEVQFGVSLNDDLARRDFTINAIAYHPLRHEWRDPFEGRKDIAKKTIRSVGDPNWRFQEDYLRILRALRFSARFGFRIHRETREAAKANAQWLAQLSAERVREEWFKGIETAIAVVRFILLWEEVGAARVWLPELNREWQKDKRLLQSLDRDPVLITAIIARDPASLLTRLKASTRDIERGRAIRQWRSKYPDYKDLGAVRRWMADVGEHVSDLLKISRTPGLLGAVSAIKLRNDPLTLKDLAITGDDLMEAGVRRGPEVGETLKRLLDEVLEDPTRNTREYLLSRV